MFPERYSSGAEVNRRGRESTPQQEVVWDAGHPETKNIPIRVPRAGVMCVGLTGNGTHGAGGGNRPPGFPEASEG